MEYDLDHLTQEEGKTYLGPIQDDEALLLFALCRVIGAKRVAEFGFGSGYSARNFLAAVGVGGTVYSVDIELFHIIAENHVAIVKSCGDVVSSDFGGEKLDLVLFDCHSPLQLQAFHRMRDGGIIDSKTIIAIHDTGKHGSALVPGSIDCIDGFIHQPVERDLSNHLYDLGWHSIHLHGLPRIKDRHGLTLMQHSPILR